MSHRVTFGLLFLASWPLYAEAPKATHVIRLQGGVTWLTFTPDSKQLFACSNAMANLASESEYQVQAWDVATGKATLGPVKGLGIGATGVISPNGQWLLTGGTNSDWRLWQTADLSVVAKGKTEGGRIHRLAFNPDNKSFALLRAEYQPRNKIKYAAWTFDTATQKAIATQDWPAERATTGSPAGWTRHSHPSFDKWGQLMLPPKGAIEPFEVPDDEDNCGGPMDFVISANGKMAVSAGCSGTVVLWEYPDRNVIGKPLAKHDRLAVGEQNLAISADGRFVGVASNAEHSSKGHLYRITIYDTKTRQAILGPVELGYSGVGLIADFAFSPDASHFAVALNRLGGQLKGPTHELQLWALPKKTP